MEKALAKGSKIIPQVNAGITSCTMAIAIPLSPFLYATLHSFFAGVACCLWPFR
jgi:hypothetical protein